MREKKDRILIIEDDEPVADIYEGMLQRQGYSATAVHTFDTAKYHLNETPFSVVLSDIFIPPHTGIDVLGFTKKVQPNTPVILITGLPSIESAIDAIREGAYDYLIKPVKQTQLISTIERACHLYHLKKAKGEVDSENQKMRTQLEHLLKNRTDELIESRERYRLLFKGSKDAVFITTPDGRWLFDVNQAALEMIGYSKDELLHLKIEMLFAKPDIRFSLGQRLIEKGFVRDFAVVLKKKSDQWIHCMITASVYYTKEKVMAGYHGIVRDVTQEREAAKKIRDQKDFLENVVESLSHPFSVIDTSTQKVLMANKAAVSKKRQFIRGVSVSLNHDSERFYDGLSTPSALKRVVLEKRPVVVEEQCQDERGTVKDFEIHGHPILDSDGSVIQMIEYAIDITTRKTAERELVKRETILESVRYSAETFLKSDRWDENIHMVLQRLGKALGVSRLSIFEAKIAESSHLVSGHTESGEKSVLTLHHQWRDIEKCEWLDEKKMNCIDLEKEGLQRWKSLLLDGRTIYGNIEDFDLAERHALSCRNIVSTAILPIFIKKMWWGALIFDECLEKRAWSITEIDGLKVAAETLGAAIYHTEQARERILLASALEQHSDGIIILNTEKEVTYVNPAFEGISGYSFYEVISSPLSLLNPGFEKEPTLSEMDEKLNAGLTWNGELTNQKKDGTPYREEMTIFPVKDETGRTLNYVAIKRDVTEKQRLESIAEAANMMENIGYIFAGIRHEIGNPLNSIKMTLTVLKKNVDHYSPAKTIEFLDRTLNEIGRVEYLLKAFKNFSLYENPDIKAIDLNQFMSRFTDLIHDDFEKRCINIHFETSKKESLGFGDPRMLNQIMLNLVINAADAMAEVASPEICIRIQPLLEKIRIRVSDNGYGLSADEKKKIFTPFYTTKARGTGLGLVIVRKMLLSMNASIRVESIKNKGTTFSFDLPRIFEGYEKDMLNF